MHVNALILIKKKARACFAASIAALQCKSIDYRVLFLLSSLWLINNLFFFSHSFRVQPSIVTAPNKMRMRQQSRQWLNRLSNHVHFSCKITSPNRNYTDKLCAYLRTPTQTKCGVCVCVLLTHLMCSIRFGSCRFCSVLLGSSEIWYDCGPDVIFFSFARRHSIFKWNTHTQLRVKARPCAHLP